MKPVEKLILTDAENRPVAVQIKYADWLEIERELNQSGKNGTRHGDLQRFAGTLRLPADPVDYQRQARDEWR
jgi:hypothetical protein